MKCLWYISLLLFFPAGNKEINKGLYSGTSSFSFSADSISPNRAVSYVQLSDSWYIQSIDPQRPLSLTDTEMSHLCCAVTGRSLLLRQRQQGRARRRGPLCVEALPVKPIRCLWTNWASLIDQWTDPGGGLFFLGAFFLLFIMSRTLCSLWDKIPFVPDTKHPFQHTGVIYIRAFVCGSLADLPHGLYAIYVLLPG